MANFPCAFARFPVVLGEDDYTKRLSDQVRKVAQGMPLHFPNLEARMSFIHAQDAAEALALVLDHKKSGPYNFSAPTRSA